jgi:hypothetical protein
MAARETVCLKRLGGDRGGEEAAGRFFANPKVKVDRIVESWSQHTGPAAQGRHVLAIHDRSAIKFRTRAKRRRGLGKVGHGNIHGLLVHAMLAVDADSGACLGLVGGEVWNRNGKVTPLRGRARPVGAGIAPLGGHRRAGEDGAGRRAVGDGGGRQRKRPLRHVGDTARIRLSSADPGPRRTAASPVAERCSPRRTAFRWRVGR